MLGFLASWLLGCLGHRTSYPKVQGPSGLAGGAVGTCSDWVLAAHACSFTVESLLHRPAPCCSSSFLPPPEVRTLAPVRPPHHPHLHPRSRPPSFPSTTVRFPTPPPPPPPIESLPIVSESITHPYLSPSTMTAMAPTPPPPPPPQSQCQRHCLGLAYSDTKILRYHIAATTGEARPG